MNELILIREAFETNIIVSMNPASPLTEISFTMEILLLRKHEFPRRFRNDLGQLRMV